jgi:glucose-1-phosphate adenylyltransferase
MKRVSDVRYMGTGDAVYQNIYSIGSEESVLILSGDHLQNELTACCSTKIPGADVTATT